jgi:hypothetical protein
MPVFKITDKTNGVYFYVMVSSSSVEPFHKYFVGELEIKAVNDVSEFDNVQPIAVQVDLKPKRVRKSKVEAVSEKKNTIEDLCSPLTNVQSIETQVETKPKRVRQAKPKANACSECITIDKVPKEPKQKKEKKPKPESGISISYDKQLVRFD